MLSWLKRESLATLAMLGAALTVLAQLRHAIPMAPWLERLLDYWQEILRDVWRPPLDWLGVPLHPHLVAALTLAVFLALIAAGGRVSARLAGKPLPPIELNRFLDGMSWPSLIVFAALAIVFLVGQGDAEPLVLWGSRDAGRYGFAIKTAVG